MNRMERKLVKIAMIPGFADESVGNLDGFSFLMEIPDTNYVHTEHGQEFLKVYLESR